MREEVVDLEDGSRIRLQLSEFSVPMKELQAEIRVSPAPNGTTEVSFDIGYVMKSGVLGKLMGATAVRRQLNQVTAKVLAGLGHHATTGELVGKDFAA